MSPENNERSDRLDSAASVTEEVSSTLTDQAAAVEEVAVVPQPPQPAESLANAVVDDGMFHHREKCRNQHLPTTVLLKPILDDSFLTEARELAGLEAAALHLFQLLLVPTQTLNEVRQFTGHPKYAAVLDGRLEASNPAHLRLAENGGAPRPPRNNDVSPWALNVVSGGSTSVAELLAIELEEERKALRPTPGGNVANADINNLLRISSHEYLKAHIFGPEIEEFTMELPEYFPKRAGQGRHALRFQLEEYRESLKKMEKDRVPQTLAEAEEPSLWRDMQHWLERRKRKKILHEQIENLLNRDAAVHVVSQSLYNGRRRNACAELPGCQSHYPNSSYTDPCQDFDYSFPAVHTKASMMGVLFGKKTPPTRVVMPVGRRAPRQAISAPTAAAKSEAADTPAAEKGMSSKRGSGKSKKVETKALAADLAETFSSGSSAKVAPTELALETDSTKSAERPASTAMEVKSIALSHAGVAVDRPTKGLDSNGIPFGVFLGRRGSFPATPGLEHFALTAELPPLAADGARSGSSSSSAASEVDVASKGSQAKTLKTMLDMDLSRFPGLIRRFGVNVRFLEKQSSEFPFFSHPLPFVGI